MENILILGGAGFIGSALADRLIAMNHKVTVFDSLEGAVHPDGKPPVHINPNIHFIKGDVCNYSHLKRVVKDKSLIINMAAHVIDRPNEIKRYLDTNVGGTANLLECLLNTENCCRKMIHASMIHRSTRKLFAQNPFYYISKKLQEENVYKFSRLFHFPVVILRYSQVYGIRQSLSTGLGPMIMRILEHHFDRLFLRKNSMMLDFISIRDAVDATVKALFSPAANGKIYDVGSGTTRHLHDVTCLLLQQLKRRLPTLYIPEQSQRFEPVFTCATNIEPIRADLGFDPENTFELDISRIVDWLLSPEGFVYLQAAKDNLKTSKKL